MYTYILCQCVLVSDVDDIQSTCPHCILNLDKTQTLKDHGLIILILWVDNFLSVLLHCGTEVNIVRKCHISGDAHCSADMVQITYHLPPYYQPAWFQYPEGTCQPGVMKIRGRRLIRSGN